MTEEPPLPAAFPDPTPDPPLDPAPNPVLPDPEPEPFPFWGFGDLFLVAALSVPCMLAGWAAVRFLMWILHVRKLPPAFEIVPEMLLGYVLICLVVATVFRVQYGKPFWRSMGWIPTGVPLAWNILAGFGASFLVVLVGLAVHAPKTEGPMMEMMKNRPTLILLAVFGTTAAPLFEELGFRGFLQPLLVRYVGAIAGIGLAAALFGGLHFWEYGDSWSSSLMVAVAGAAFGLMRHRTQSTKAAVIMHSAFNALSFISLFSQKP